MLLFLLGAICGVAISAILMNEKNRGTGSNVPKETTAPKAQEAFAAGNGKRVAVLDIPIVILSNLYSLTAEHPTIKYKGETLPSGNTYERISVDCELHYQLNGRKEGKRCFVFSYYDKNGNLLSHNETNAYRMTDSGIEIVHTECSVTWSNLPEKICISVREVC